MRLEARDRSNMHPANEIDAKPSDQGIWQCAKTRLP